MSMNGPRQVLVKWGKIGNVALFCERRSAVWVADGCGCPHRADLESGVWAVSGLFAGETPTMNSLAAIAAVRFCHLRWSLLTSLFIGSIDSRTAYFIPDTPLNLGNPK